MSAQRKAEDFIEAVCDPAFTSQLLRLISGGAQLESPYTVEVIQLNLAAMRARSEPNGNYARIKSLVEIIRGLHAQGACVLDESLLLEDSEIETLRSAAHRRRAIRANSSSN